MIDAQMNRLRWHPPRPASAIGQAAAAKGQSRSDALTRARRNEDAQPNLPPLALGSAFRLPAIQPACSATAVQRQGTGGLHASEPELCCAAEQFFPEA